MFEDLKDFSSGVLTGVKDFSVQVQDTGTAVSDAKAVFDSAKNDVQIAAAQAGFAQAVGTAQGQQTGSVGAVASTSADNINRLIAGVKSNQSVLLIAAAALLGFFLLKGR